VSSTGGETAPASSGDQRTEWLTEAQRLWADRDDESALRQAIALWERATQADPTDPGAWADLAHAYYFLGDGHLSFDDGRRPQMLTAYEKSMEAAERSLIALSPDFAQRMRAGTQIEEAIDILDERAVPALYWRSSAMARWGTMRSFATVLSYKDEVRAVMSRCLELDASYYHAGPHRYFGAFYARLPAFAGGDLDRSRAHFEAALEADPTYLGTRLLYAQHYAVKAQDRALFDAQIETILATDPEARAAIAPENAVEQRRARQLMEQVSELFE
jgi:tetratricopeptide (TPR) repeat protein